MKLLIVDDHPMTGFGLKALLEAKRSHWQVQVVPDASVLRQGDWPWNLVILDMHMPGETFSDLLEELQRRISRVVMISANPEADLVERAKARGARGLLLKNARPESLLADLDRIVAGEAVFNESDELFGSISAPDHLTSRQQEVYRGLVSGLSNKQIARKLEISEHTVKEHVAAVLAAMGVRTRMELILKDQNTVV